MNCQINCNDAAPYVNIPKNILTVLKNSFDFDPEESNVPLRIFNTLCDDMIELESIELNKLLNSKN